MKGKSIVIGEVIINEKGKKIVTLVLSGVILLISGAIGQILWGLMYGVAVCGIHAFLRPRNVSSKTNKLYEGDPHQFMYYILVYSLFARHSFLEFKLNGYNSWFGFADSGNADIIDPENPRGDDDSSESTSFVSNDAVRKRNSGNGTSH